MLTTMSLVLFLLISLLPWQLITALEWLDLVNGIRRIANVVLLLKGLIGNCMIHTVSFVVVNQGDDVDLMVATLRRGGGKRKTRRRKGSLPMEGRPESLDTGTRRCRGGQQHHFRRWTKRRRRRSRNARDFPLLCWVHYFWTLFQSSTKQQQQQQQRRGRVHTMCETMERK